ncbi:type-1 restriction enzyme R protein [mine drainage metagenome]|uniref:type I site-specific deoxyribonuclease n=1 Tax=mine drainage metagenome TaxID=410659 RepID=A0A1J5QIB5_9ZZZZ
MTEDQLEQEALGWLADVGYTVLHGPDIAPDKVNGEAGEGALGHGDHAERADYRQVLLPFRLRESITRLNPGIPTHAREDAIHQVLDLGIPSQLSANRRFHQLLVAGVPVEYQLDGETRGDFVRLVDWANPAHNEWLAINQFSIKGPHHTRRPDIILFVNGLPLVLLEIKNPADENADIWKAFDQLQTYKEQIPEVFHYNEVLVISDGSDARMGSLSSDAERFMQWRTIDGATLDPLGQFNELETLIRGVLAPAILLDYLRFFVLFEDDGDLVKKIAGYHQFHAVRAAIDQVVAASRPDGNHKGGVVWHTQGSGKSITMTCFAARVMQEAAMENPTIVVITDRNDLDGQLFGVFSLAQGLLREQPVQAETRQDLRARLGNRPSGGIVFATIQKFMPGEDEDTYPVLSDRRNIVVIADEAHRTQYGFEAKLKTIKPPLASANDERALLAAEPAASYQVGYAQHLRNALPNATFVAFTGTPVSSEDRDTRAVFGDYIHVYDMLQAREDGATVAIYFESRLARLGLKADDLPQLDAEVDALAEDEEESQQAKLKSRWAALEKVVGSEPRIASVAADLVSHFEERDKAQSGKAMVVAMSREICVHLYNEIIRLRPEWHDADPEKGAIKVVMTGSASDKALLRPHIYSAQVKKRLEKRFKDPADPLRIVIVRDMWLTGFDAPCVHTLYVDKPMKGHNLMQAIARVNRVFKDKQGGLVVDYIGIANELKAALKDYTLAHGKGRPTIDVEEMLRVLLEKMEVLHGLLHGCDYGAFRTDAWTLLPAVANHVLGQDDGMKRFADAVLAATRAFSLCCTLDRALECRDELAFLQAVKAALTKHTTQDKKLADEQKEHALRQIISRAVVSAEVVDIFQAAGLNKPDIGILSDEFLDDVRHMKERNLAVELLERLLKDDIRARFRTNVVKSAKFSELLQESLKRYRNRAIETAQVIEELIAMARQFQEEARRGAELGLDPAEQAFYDALAANEAAVRELGDATLKKIAVELTQKLRKSVTVDWSVRDAVRASLRVMVKTLLKRYKYPPDKQDEATETVLRQAERLSEEWVGA